MRNRIYKRQPLYGLCPKCGKVGHFSMIERKDREGNTKKIDCYYVHNVDGIKFECGHVKTKRCNIGLLNREQSPLDSISSG